MQWIIWRSVVIAGEMVGMDSIVGFDVGDIDGWNDGNLLWDNWWCGSFFFKVSCT